MKPDKISLALAMVIILTTTSWITSCTHKPNASDFPEICFARDVLPIFLNNCANSRCHDGGGGRESAMALTNYSEISRSVVPGNPDGSRVYKAIISKGGESTMPPGQPLSLGNRTIIRIWIEQGAALTTCPASTATGNDIKSGISNGYLINR
jgi:Planctomycete cytochrome C